MLIKHFKPGVPVLLFCGLFIISLTAYSSAQAVATGFLNEIPWDLLVIDLKASIASLDEIIGEAVSPDVLDQIFSQFCIGK